MKRKQDGNFGGYCSVLSEGWWRIRPEHHGKIPQSAQVAIMKYHRLGLFKEQKFISLHFIDEKSGIRGPVWLGSNKSSLAGLQVNKWLSLCPHLVEREISLFFSL